ncbi:MAG: GspE/PulE family protein [Planctomycetota bacterium]|nr:GspE/PulE family protein [Planctomycetota bacterium]
MSSTESAKSTAKGAEEVRFEQLPAASGVPTEDAVAGVLDEASRMGASDLFLCSAENFLEVGVRHLGLVRTLMRVTREDGRRWLSHIKVLAGIPLDNRRKPNEGRWIRLHPNGHKTDLRVNTIPTLYGEDFAIRLLERDSSLQTLEGLGLAPPTLRQLVTMLHAPGGLILVTGPTSSGKTTTLYACLHYLNNGTRKINTIEDPIEYAVEGIRQSQVNPALDVDFPELLRSVLRQAPDIIMIGEIRDAMTAQTAVRAANSGHLVLATLHAPTAAGAIQSMLALGANPHFFGSSLRGVIAQRLVRSLCTNCRVTFDISDAPLTFEEVMPWLVDDEGKHLYTATGCEQCHKTGYAGRTGVFEVMSVTPVLRKMISDGAPGREIETRAIADGMIEFRRGGLLKVAQGVTNTEEIIRVVPSEYLGLS